MRMASFHTPLHLASFLFAPSGEARQGFSFFDYREDPRFLNRLRFLQLTRLSDRVRLTKTLAARCGSNHQGERRTVAFGRI